MSAMALRWEKEEGRIAVLTLDEPDARNALTAKARELGRGLGGRG